MMILGSMQTRSSVGNSRACGILLLLAATPAWASTADFGPFALEVPARGFEEHCVKLEAGQRIRYRFSAGGDVDFNLHYHRGTDVFYPVKTAATRSADGVYTAAHADGYCLMWERRGDGAVRVEGAVELDFPRSAR